MILELIELAILLIDMPKGSKGTKTQEQSAWEWKTFKTCIYGESKH